MNVSSIAVRGGVSASPAAGTKETASAAVSNESIGLIRRAAWSGIDGRSAISWQDERRDVTRKSISGAVREWVTSIAVMWRFGDGMSQRPGATVWRDCWMVATRVRMWRGGRAQKVRQLRGSVNVGSAWGPVRFVRTGSRVHSGKSGDRIFSFCWLLRVMRWML